MPRVTRTPGRTRLTAEQRRDTILTAATTVFSEYGYSRAKVSDIAARIGVSEPVVFQNFGSKARLFAAVLDRAADTAIGYLDSLQEPDLPVPEILRALLAPEHIDAMHAPGSLGVLFADGAAADVDPVVGDAARVAIGRVARGFAALLARGSQAGQFRADLDADAAAWWLISFVSARPLRRAVDGELEVERRMIDMALEMFRALPPGG